MCTNVNIVNCVYIMVYNKYSNFPNLLWVIKPIFVYVFEHTHKVYLYQYFFFNKIIWLNIK